MVRNWSANVTGPSEAGGSSCRSATEIQATEGIARLTASFPVRCDSRSDIADNESSGLREPLRLAPSARHLRSGFHRFRPRVRELFPRRR